MSQDGSLGYTRFDRTPLWLHPQLHIAYDCWGRLESICRFVRWSRSVSVSPGVVGVGFYQKPWINQGLRCPLVPSHSRTFPGHARWQGVGTHRNGGIWSHVEETTICCACPDVPGYGDRWCAPKVRSWHRWAKWGDSSQHCWCFLF